MVWANSCAELHPSRSLVSHPKPTDEECLCQAVLQSDMLVCSGHRLSAVDEPYARPPRENPKKENMKYMKIQCGFRKENHEKHEKHENP